MDHDFWQARWREGRIGFHQAEGSEMLRRHRDRLLAGGARRVLAPLCGKARDLWTLAEAGVAVVGVELSPLAAEAFFAEAGVEPGRSERGAFSVLGARGVEIWVGDFFAFTPELAGTFEAVYDRAALVALPDETRGLYAEHLGRCTAGGGVVLLVTLEYDQQLAAGPPFSVPEGEVRRLFAGWSGVERLSERQEEAQSARLKEKGVETIAEVAWLLAR